MPPSSTARSSPAFRRQKLRKGTFSCWECKTRKIRCEYESPSDSACKSCQRRGVQCISQEYIEVKRDGYEHVGERIENVEAMINRLIETKRGGHFHQQVQDLQTLKSATSSSDKTELTQRTNSSPSSSSILSRSQQSLNECFSLSHYLHSILPKDTVTMMIFSQGNYFQMPINMLRWPKKQCNSRNKPENLLVQFSRKPPPTAHPIFFAQKLYRLALCMQRLDPTTFYETKNNLKESVDVASRRFAEIASKYVTSQDMLVDSLEGLETLMLESGYLVSMGNHRAAWLTLRRALGLAELMGLRKTNVTDDDSKESVWYLLNYCDRFLSAISGFPCNGFDDNFASDSVLVGKKPVERLARTHAAIMGRIIARNLKMQSHNDSAPAYEVLDDNYSQTQAIDCDLRQAAKILPTQSWAMPNLRNSAADQDLMEKTSMLQVQMHQYYLLLLLHQPYLLRPLHSQRATRVTDRVDYTYCKLNALSASRELLSRFVVMRDIHHSTSYRGIDHKAWIASVTLLLAHIDGKQSSANNSNLLAHQRPQDLAIVHRLIQRLDLDNSTTESAQQLRTLLQIEENAANGVKYCFTWADASTSAKNGKALPLSIPYFGTISILSSRLEASETSNASVSLQEIETLGPSVIELRSDNFFDAATYKAPVCESLDSCDTFYESSFSTSDVVPCGEPTPSLSLDPSDYISFTTEPMVQQNLSQGDDADCQVYDNWDELQV
ncbi:hypothetical protein UA08_03952 [Talaromyces atroroseus]|uniref:Zn(2)-C6 fungal-type domain-containing protein n=1 Tax=Talaromyces atroroseus TaxID=1441469 RepID=A0A1Q5Q970_TALAT|nr:hypothetical protein UA08_03952 [Talaromyces atroroseus]OKL60678.1 hypothetical protein UA08_03952 [Talaromyces atroroseus]